MLIKAQMSSKHKQASGARRDHSAVNISLTGYRGKTRRFPVEIVVLPLIGDFICVGFEGKILTTDR